MTRPTSEGYFADCWQEAVGSEEDIFYTRTVFKEVGCLLHAKCWLRRLFQKVCGHCPESASVCLLQVCAGMRMCPYSMPFPARINQGSSKFCKVKIEAGRQSAKKLYHRGAFVKALWTGPSIPLVCVEGSCDIRLESFVSCLDVAIGAGFKFPVPTILKCQTC